MVAYWAGSVPLALAGALLFSFLGFTSLNVYSQVGLITLVGLVAKERHLIVEFANHLQEKGLDKLHAVLEASSTRVACRRTPEEEVVEEAPAAEDVVAAPV